MRRVNEPYLPYVSFDPEVKSETRINQPHCEHLAMKGASGQPPSRPLDGASTQSVVQRSVYPSTLSAKLFSLRHRF